MQTLQQTEQPQLITTFTQLGLNRCTTCKKYEIQSVLNTKNNNREYYQTNQIRNLIEETR